jgi:prephenate decarboxylase
MIAEVPLEIEPMLRTSDGLSEFVRGRRGLAVGTLGPADTSSDHVARAYIRAARSLALAPTPRLLDCFDELCDALERGNVDLALVPHAYQGINKFYMRTTLRLLDVFVCPTPVYGLATRAGYSPGSGITRVVTHPAPIPLLERLLPQVGVRFSNIELKTVNATAIAARLVRDGMSDIALTNARAVESYDLEFRAVHGPVRMGWSIFGREFDR